MTSTTQSPDVAALVEELRVGSRKVRNDGMHVYSAAALMTQAADALTALRSIPAGMVPWPGGDSAPEDWDGTDERVGT